MSGLADAIRVCRQDGRPPVVGFLPAGFPEREIFAEVVATAFDHGIAAMEVGLPLTDPSLDGEGIAAAFADVPLTIDEQRTAVARIARSGPVIAMCYAGGLPAARLTREASALRDAGAAALLVPDVDTSRQLALCDEAPLPVGVFLSDRDDLDLLVAHTGTPPGFVYLRSSRRLTGEPIDLDVARSRLGEVRAALRRSDVPLLVGFGVQTPVQVHDLLEAGADAVVVGTEVVAAARQGQAAVADLVAQLCARRAGSPRG